MSENLPGKKSDTSIGNMNSVAKFTEVKNATDTPEEEKITMVKIFRCKPKIWKI